MKTLEKQTGENQDPLYRFFFREGSEGRKLLTQVRKDLVDVIKVCEGGVKQTNHHLRALMSSLTKGSWYDGGCAVIGLIRTLQVQCQVIEGVTKPQRQRLFLNGL